MKFKKEILDKIPFKETNYIFGLVFIYILILPNLFPLSNVMTAIFVGVYCYNTNKKGFSKSRAIKRKVTPTGSEQSEPQTFMCSPFRFSRQVVRLE